MAKLIKSKIENLTPDDHNFNKGSEYGNHLIEKSFREFGAGRSILIDRNNRIIAGNKSIEAASSIGMENVVIVETTGDEIVAVKRTDIDLDSKKGRELALADNATNKANLDFDEEEISKLSEQFEFDASDWGIDLGIDVDVEEAELSEDEKRNIEKRCNLGDVWKLGNHRLMCGDSTDLEQVKQLLGGVNIDMLFTDPPYNVAFNGRSGKFDVIENDNLSNADFTTFIKRVISVIKALNLKTYYIWCNWKFYGLLQQNLEFKNCIVWANNVFGMGRGYRHQHEFCLFNGMIDPDITNESDLWEIAKDTNYIHPTQKPTALCARALNNHRNVKNVLDLFGGSGSTLIACEQTGRKCYTMELDPIYCDVIIERWEKLTGLKAELVESKTQEDGTM